MTLRYRALALLSVALSGCGPALRSNAGLELIKGISPTVPTVKAARVHHQAVLIHQGKTLRFQIWSVGDSSSGRLEASGPLGIGLATVLWDDTSWQASLPGQSTLLRGKERTLNLPVLNLRDVDPSRLFTPFLGRALVPAGSFRTIAAPENQTLLIPTQFSPTWSLLLDNATGLPVRRQTLWQGKEIEAISYMKWQDRQGILVPGRMIRTTADGQRLELDLKDWDRLDQLPAGSLHLRVPQGTDTITVGTAENGRKVFQMNQPGQEPDPSLSKVPSDSPEPDAETEWEDDSPSAPPAPDQKPIPAPARERSGH